MPFRRGACEVSIEYTSDVGAAQLACGDEWAVRPTRELRENLNRLLGDNAVRIHYPKHFT
jgi:hypothetical protein